MADASPLIFSQVTDVSLNFVSYHIISPYLFLAQHQLFTHPVLIACLETFFTSDLVFRLKKKR